MEWCCWLVRKDGTCKTENPKWVSVAGVDEVLGLCFQEVLVQKDASEQASCFLFIYEKLFWIFMSDPSGICTSNIEITWPCSQNLFINLEHFSTMMCFWSLICVSWFHGQFLTTVHSGDVVGDIGVLCYIPQPFTVRTRKLSQVLRLDRTVFMSIVQSFPEDGKRIVDNLLQVWNFLPCVITWFSFQRLIHGPFQRFLLQRLYLLVYRSF